jgi:Agrobacterium tumefaciens protein Atu4866
MKPFSMLAAAAVLVVAAVQSDPKSLAQMNLDPKPAAQPAQSHPYVGMWITVDGHVRHNLLPNGRYDEARGQRESAYQGRYEVQGADIYYWDDTGFTADGKFIDGVLHHGGMILYRAE